MIQWMEIWNFESHEHTLFKDFSKGFNLFCGISNVGKCLTGDAVIVDTDGSMRTVLDMLKQGEWFVPSCRNDKFEFCQSSAIKIGRAHV